ncbi:hypothetical protein H4582DRAFT_2201105 [Lactarius indigo]|nr:hypothetical protein H4582DRAFT_2201105 [Lactarius indigo]
MKRGADRQLSKDDDPDNEIEEVSTGFQMAKESDLARRDAAVCPNRAAFGSSPLTPARNYQPAAAPKFGYFSGFGATSGVTTPFTFAPSAPAGQPQEPAETSHSSAPVVAESASNATKKFASFLGPSSTAGAKPAVPSPDSSKSDASGDTDEIALKYYTYLRGLNTSFLSAVSKAIESDPFVDVVDLLEQYKNHRISVQTEYDGKSSQSTTRGAPSAASKLVSSPAPLSFGKPATSTSAAMPVPPSSFAGFPALSTTASSASPALGTGFTPSPAAAAAGSSSFGFPSVPPASSDTKPSAASSSPFGAFAAAPSSSSSSAFKPDTAPSSKPGFSFGASAATSTNSSASPFGSSQPNSSTSLFGSPPKSSTLFGSDKSPAAEGKEKEKPASNAFGSAPFTLSIPPGTKLFGDTSSSNSSSGSIFGAKSTEKEKEKEKDASPPSSVFGATTFGSPAKPSSSPFGGFGSAAGEGDAEGEGEEDEETTYTVKAKVYKFTTDSEGAPSWAEMGIGMLRLKKHKVTNARRVILRSSTTGKIIINFRIYTGLQPKRTGKTVAFTGHITSPDKETQTVQYRLRVGTEATATEMAEAIEREVRLVQAEAS